ncbi:MAG: hypothetical protein JWM58_1640 [Rhizobium sp.]|nr:hypothetical protein [Rhizobium sp.]
MRHVWTVIFALFALSSLASIILSVAHAIGLI